MFSTDLQSKIIQRFGEEQSNLPVITHKRWGVPKELLEVEYDQSYYGEGNLLYQDWWCYQDGILWRGTEIIGA